MHKTKLLGAEPGTSFYVHNDIFRYQDDIFTDDYPPAEPVEIEKYEEDSPLPQDNGDHATQVTRPPDPGHWRTIRSGFYHFFKGILQLCTIGN